jgi:hypothetical protein
VSFIKFDSEIDGKRFFVVREENCSDVGDGSVIEPESERKYAPSIHVFKDEEQAGDYAREYWRDYIEGDPASAVEILGAENLVQWALGRSAGPGMTKVNSLEEWLDLYKEDPSEHFESGPYEIEAIGQNIVEKLGFRPTVAYCMDC